MKKNALLLLLLLIFSCDKEQHDLTVKVNIKDLKKGNVYLKKVNDSTLITVDSLIISGNSEFELHSALESPEMFYLYLDKNDNVERKVSFFADNGITEINTSLKNFEIDCKIVGSEQQKILEEYQKVQSRFNGQNLDLIKENYDAQIEGDTVKSLALKEQNNNLIKRKYLYTVNFAMNHKDSEVSPYLALTQIYDANVKWLDTINNSLTPKVKASKYGKELQRFIDDIKNENTAK